MLRHLRSRQEYWASVRREAVQRAYETVAGQWGRSLIAFVAVTVASWGLQWLLIGKDAAQSSVYIALTVLLGGLLVAAGYYFYFFGVVGFERAKRSWSKRSQLRSQLVAENIDLSVTIRPEITDTGLLLTVENKQPTDLFRAMLLRFPVAAGKPRDALLPPRSGEGESQKIYSGMHGNFNLCEFCFRPPSVTGEHEGHPLYGHPMFVLSTVDTTGRRLAAGFFLAESKNADGTDFDLEINLPIRIGAEDAGATLDCDIVLELGWFEDTGRSQVTAKVPSISSLPRSMRRTGRVFQSNHWDKHDACESWTISRVTGPPMLMLEALTRQQEAEGDEANTRDA